MPLHSDDTPLKDQSRERDLEEAIGRVYERYGADLSSFFRDAQRQTHDERCEKIRNQSWTFLKKW
jgi:hypothetical protein